MRASFLEIYNEEIRDLLDADAKNHQPGRGLELKETRDKGRDRRMLVWDAFMFRPSSIDRFGPSRR